MPSMIECSAIPAEFLCPITHEIMREPVMSITGFNFEKESILTWMTHHNNTCPLSRRSLRLSDLATNHALQDRIEVWCRAHGVVAQEETRSTNKDETSITQNAPLLFACMAKSTQTSRQNQSSRSRWQRFGLTLRRAALS